MRAALGFPRGTAEGRPGRGGGTDVWVRGSSLMGPPVGSHVFGLAFSFPPLPCRAASGPTALFRNTKAAGAAIGSVKNMLLEWCRAMTRNYEVGTEQGQCGAGGPSPGRQV